MIGMGNWEIIKCLDSCIDAQSVNMGESLNGGCFLKLINERGVVKNLLDRKRYLFIFRQEFLNPNSDKTLLVEEKIECYGLKVYSFPTVFGSKKLIDAKDQVGGLVKLSIR